MAPAPLITISKVPSLTPSMMPFDGAGRRRRFMIVVTSAILLVVGVFTTITIVSQMH